MVDRIEFNASGSFRPSDTLYADASLTESANNLILASMREKQIAAAQPFTLAQGADTPATIRDRVVDAAARAIIKDQGLFRDGESGVFVAGAIQHQYKYNGGEAAADSVAKDITAKLPKGWTLTITDDPDFKKQVEDESRRTGAPLPSYIRKVQLFDAEHKSLGAIGVSIDGPPTTRTKT